MKARKVLEGASFDPDTLRALGQAFDAGWAGIAHVYSSPLEIDRARLRLANSLLAVAKAHGRDVEALKNAALQHMALSYRDRSDPGSSHSS